MKPYTYSLLAAAIACSMAHGATAYTTPVGYLTVNIPANADTTIAPSLHQSALLQGASTGISGNVITCTATGAATNAFVNASPDTNAKTYVLVNSGALKGLRYPVTANDGTTVTVDGGATTLQAQGFATGDSFSVVPYWTLSSLFPSGTGVGQSTDLFSPTSFVLFSDQVGVGFNRAASKFYFYYTGDIDFPAGWYDNDNVFAGVQDTVAIDPSVLMTVRSGGTSSVVTVTGTVPNVTLATKILTDSGTNDEYLASPYPVDTTLAQSGLQSVVSAAPDVFNPTDLVFVYPDEAAGFNKGTSATYFYFGGDLDFPAGWYDADNVFSGAVTDPVLKAGRCFLVRKAGGTPASSTWTAPLPYSL